MRKLDPRSVIIGFLLAVISLMSIGAKNTTFDTITVGNIKMKNSEINILGRDGVRRVKFIDGFSGALMSLHRDNGNPVVYIGDDGNGSGTALFLNNRMKTIVTIANPQDTNDGNILLHNSNGSIAWGITAGIKLY
jgi:hypothetical protein